MSVVETLINAAAGNKILSFMDGNAGYNQIFIAPEDIHKTAFRVPSAVGLFEYVVMTIGLKNVGTTYQRTMNYIYHDLIGKLVEIYIDDLVVKSTSIGFLVHERGIEIGRKSQEAVRTMVPPTTKRELQLLIGKINFVS
jgi:hypothetical protein